MEAIPIVVDNPICAQGWLIKSQIRYGHWSITNFESVVRSASWRAFTSVTLRILFTRPWASLLLCRRLYLCNYNTEVKGKKNFPPAWHLICKQKNPQWPRPNLHIFGSVCVVLGLCAGWFNHRFDMVVISVRFGELYCCVFRWFPVPIPGQEGQQQDHDHQVYHGGLPPRFFPGEIMEQFPSFFSKFKNLATKEQ